MTDATLTAADRAALTALGFTLTGMSAWTVGACRVEAPRGEFRRMIANGELPFGLSTAERFMQIARDPKLTNPAHGQARKLSSECTVAMLADRI